MAKLSFMSVAKFKQHLGIQELKIVDAPKTPGKLAILADDTSWFRCATNIDVKRHMAFVIEDGDLNAACLCNVNPPKTLNVKHTL